MGLKWLAMSQFGRISTSQKYSLAQDHVLMNQQALFEDTQRMNLGKRRLNAYEDPFAALKSQQLTSSIKRNTHLEELRSGSKSELEVAESSLAGIQEILTKMKQDAVQGSNGTMGSTERLAIAEQLRNQGLNIIQLLNSKIGNKYIFSGTSSDQKTVTLQEGADFRSAAYRGGQTTLAEREVLGLQTSVNLTDILTSDATSASVTGTNLNPVATGQIRLLIDDGAGRIYDTGDISFNGNNISTIVTKINTAFTNAGGSGAIARQYPTGYLNLDTSLVTGNSENSQARITVKAGTTVGTALTNIGLTAGNYRGTDGSLLETISKLEAGYRLNDTSLISTAQSDLDANIARTLSKRAELGHLIKRVDAQMNFESAQNTSMQVRRSDNDDIPVAEAINAITKAQNALNSTLDVSAKLFSQNIFDFLIYL